MIRGLQGFLFLPSIFPFGENVFPQGDEKERKEASGDQETHDDYESRVSIRRVQEIHCLTPFCKPTVWHRCGLRVQRRKPIPDDWLYEAMKKSVVII
ncbi:MAG: hypothetical protein AAB853_00580 [Patescibacteria group bacterium]